jgi:hypothetical protein
MIGATKLEKRNRSIHMKNQGIKIANSRMRKVQVPVMNKIRIDGGRSAGNIE